LPPMPALLQEPFWLDPSDQHRMASAMQFLTHSHSQEYVVLSGNWRHGKVDTEQVWETAIHRVAVDGISPEQAVDEAIARVKQILSE
jgi:multiple sugar transport system substrate-binding protein